MNFPNPIEKVKLWTQKPNNNKYLFILCPPYSGSTILYQIIGTSPNVSKFTFEGEHIKGLWPIYKNIQRIMRKDPWNENFQMPWGEIKKTWHKKWDLRKEFLAEKSPPNLIRALTIENAFHPAFFILMIRNPYAFCEGTTRRMNISFEEAANFWVKCAYYQKFNLNNLKQKIFFNYETLVNSPEVIKEQILTFLPNLEFLNIDRPFKAKTVEGRKKERIKDFNTKKINKLSRKNLEEINTVLKQHPKIVQFFNYNLI